MDKQKTQLSVTKWFLSTLYLKTHISNSITTEKYNYIKKKTVNNNCNHEAYYVKQVTRIISEYLPLTF